MLYQKYFRSLVENHFCYRAIAWLGDCWYPLLFGLTTYSLARSSTVVLVFSFLTFTVAVPTAIKVFNWLATLYGGQIELKTPMLYSLAFIFLFAIGGLTGLPLGAAAVDIPLHDTYFVVAHFHYTIQGGTVIALMAAATTGGLRSR